ncbi:NAD kinase [Paremcibacter congregatus]|uniref:NAD kinase n=1 Tax=Paremcibacter congregatus TaxID=2043170 RepID=UPI0030EE0FB8|tara:strand:+ start:4438 stop:5211 length:774 start_codon:yes stop_codon:yes gene_type:complete
MIENVRKIALAASDTDSAQEAADALKECYDFVPLEEADVIVALGGDGYVLHLIHEIIPHKASIFGMNKGTVGFLLNDFKVENLLERINASTSVTLHPLRMTAYTEDDSKVEALAMNEVSLLRQTRQTAKIRVSIDGKVRMEELVCDGILLATPAGSTAYNLSAHGPIIPMRAEIMAMTPISAFRPRRWKGALLPQNAKVTFEVLNPEKRPVSAVADTKEVRHIKRVDIEQDRTIKINLLFDRHHTLEERILNEQFIY